MLLRRRRRRANPIVTAVIFFVLGIILVIAAIATDPNNVTCDGQTMTEGDVCVHYTNGAQTSENNVAQERQDQQNGRIFEIIGAILCFGGGAFYVFRFSKARTALKNGTVNAVPQPGYPQQPGRYPPPQAGYPQPGMPVQPGAYPPQSGYPQQPGMYSPPQGGYPQPGMPPQPGAYPPPVAPPYGG